MKVEGAPCIEIDWPKAEGTTQPGASGTATSRLRAAGDVRVRLIDYSPGYLADHWCSKGHVVHVLEGQIVMELQDGSATVLTSGQSVILGDDSIAHRARTDRGAKVFIVD